MQELADHHDVVAAFESCLSPPELVRDLSAEYRSRGASKYGDEVLKQWQNHRDAAAVALQSKDFAAAVVELKQALALRPDWFQGHGALHGALQRSGDATAAKYALRDGFCSSVGCAQKALEQGAGATSSIQGAHAFLKQLVPEGEDAACVALGVQTVDADGDHLLLYRDTTSGAILFATKPWPVRLLFLDVDGVMNMHGSKECGDLTPELFSRTLNVLQTSGCSVVLSTSWRSFAELRPLILGVLPTAAVVGQTPHGFENHTRAQEIAAFLALPEVVAAMNHPGSSWAVVDDMDLVEMANKDPAVKKHFRFELAKSFVKTDKNLGLDEAGAAQLVQLLTGT